MLISSLPVDLPVKIRIQTIVKFLLIFEPTFVKNEKLDLFNRPVFSVWL